MKYLLIALLALSSIRFAPAEAPATQHTDGALLLTVSGKVTTPLSLDAQALAAMPHTQLKVKDHDGKDATYAGIPLREVLTRAGAPIGNHQMHGKNVALYVLAEAADGYRAVYALAEIDAEVVELNILIADQRDGKAMDAREGPLRIIVPDEKRQARWVRQLVSLSVEEPPAAPAEHRVSNR